MVRRALHRLWAAPRLIRDRLYAQWLASRANVFVEGRLLLNGLPIVDVKDSCTLFFGKNVTLNSRNKGYHLNMHSPVKIMADRPGAIIRVGENTRIHGSCIHAYQRIEIGQNCLIAANCHIFDGNGHDLCFPDVERRIESRGTARPIEIEDNVWIAANCIVLPGVRIGRGSVISANSVVVSDVPPYVVAGGNPAKVIKNYSPA